MSLPLNVTIEDGNGQYVKDESSTQRLNTAPGVHPASASPYTVKMDVTLNSKT